MKIYGFDYKELPNEINIATQNLLFEPVSANIVKAEVFHSEENANRYEDEITIVRMNHNGICTEIAVRYFAGITEDEDDISIHLCCLEEIESVGQTIRLCKTDGLITVGEYYSLPELDAFSYILIGGDLAYRDVIENKNWDNEIRYRKSVYKKK